MPAKEDITRGNQKILFDYKLKLKKIFLIL